MNSLGNTKAMSRSYVYAPPADGKPFRLNMGLRSLEPAQWIEAGDDLLDQIPERIELAQSSREVVYQELPGYEEPVAELVERLVENLKEFHSQEYTFTDLSITHTPSGNSVDISGSDWRGPSCACAREQRVAHRCRCCDLPFAVETYRKIG
jgi:hypothetical protein